MALSPSARPLGRTPHLLWFHPKNRRSANRNKVEANKEENYTEEHHKQAEVVIRVAFAETGGVCNRSDDVEGADGLPRTAYALSHPEADIEKEHNSENGERSSENECDTTRGPLDSPPPTMMYFTQLKSFARFRGGRADSKT